MTTAIPLVVYDSGTSGHAYDDDSGDRFGSIRSRSAGLTTKLATKFPSRGEVSPKLRRKLRRFYSLRHVFRADGRSLTPTRVISIPLSGTSDKAYDEARVEGSLAGESRSSNLIVSQVVNFVDSSTPKGI